MAHLQILRGLPASGKSTYANAYVAEDLKNRIRINRDSLRLMAHNGEFEKGVTEEFILIARNELIEKFLKKGMEVLVDDTNLSKRTVSELIKIANKCGASWDVTDFTHVDVQVCIDRDLAREKSVGEHVIMDMQTRFLYNKAPLDWESLRQEVVEFKPAVRNNELDTAYIFDVDGTVAKMTDRSPYDYTKVSTDRPNYPVIDVALELSEGGHTILFTSGRPESCRIDTEAWLRRHVGVPFKLIMRQTGDTRADWIVKYEIFDREIRPNYDVLGVFDDRDQVVSMWRRIGLTCFQVDFGNF